MVKIFPFLVVIFLGQSVWSQDFPHPLATTTPAPTGTLKLSGASGASNFTTGTAPEIFAGLAGTCNENANGFCDTCTVGLLACNEFRIQNSLVLTLAIDIGGTTGAPVLQLVDEDDNTINGTTGATTTSISITWDELCGLAGIADCNVADGALAPAVQKTIKVKVWQNLNNDNVKDAGELLTMNVNFVPVPALSDTTDGANGVSRFLTFPGDEKVYLDFADLPNSPGNGSEVSAIRVLFSNVNFDQAKPGTEFGIQDIPVDPDTNEIEEPIVDGLTNGETYHFRLAVVDMAKNVFYWTSDTYIDAAATGGSGTGACDTAAAAPQSTWATCKHACMPDPVFGLLTKDLNCFVATAAYGSSLEPKLKVFRKFRYLLLHHDWGRSFVRWYYRVGPKAALMIYDKPAVRFFVRGLLWPAYGFALLTTRIGFAFAFAVSLLVLIMFIATVLKLRRRSVRAKI